jgi:hypothetical protein
LGTLPRCFESASTTDVSLTSTRRENTLFGDCPPSAVGKPADVLLRDPPRAGRRRLRSRETPDHLAVIRPPTAPCLTARHRLRVERLPRRRFRVARRERGSFFGRFTPRRSSPLAPPGTIGERTRERSRLPSVISLPRAARQCCPLSRDRGAFHRRSPDRAPLRASVRSPAPAGRRAQEPHVFIDVRKLRLDPSSRRSRGRFRAACASTTSADRCFNEHCDGPPEHPGPAENRGRDGCRLDRSLPFDRGSRRRCSGSGAEDSPSLDAPSRDCSRERLCPNPDRFRHLVSRSLCVALSGVDEGDGRCRRRRAR